MSLRSIARGLLMLSLAAGAVSLPIPSAADESLDARLSAVLDAPQFKHAHWGLLVVDLGTGETLYELNADKLFAPASTTKLFSVAAALDALGADYRFRTPIYARGEVSAEGVLSGDLVLVASGDLSMGGRTDSSGQIAFASSDHTYADFTPAAELTAPDPLGGIDELASQIAASGVKRVQGDVLVDDRLFDTATGTGSGPTLVTPIMINDNLVDLLITPAEAGAPAAVVSRPATASYEIDALVQTVAADQPAAIEVTSMGERRVVVRGRIPAGHKPLVRIIAVDDPASFARSLLIEALKRRGVTVEASPLAANNQDRLPARDGYAGLRRVAELTSPPFRESARLILKVSHNLHASTLPLLIAAKHGERTLADGLHRQREFFSRAGVEAETISFGGAAGGDRADYVTPRAAVQLLRHMAGRPDFEAYQAALPVLGVDGTLATSVGADSPAKGKVQAKTGTLIWQNTMNDRYLLTSKALAGYLTTTSERRLAFAMFVNNVHLDATSETTRIGQELGKLCEILCAE